MKKRILLALISFSALQAAECDPIYPTAKEKSPACGYGVDLFGEWLYLQIAEDGIEFAQDLPNGLGSITRYTFSPSYASAFRLGASYQMEHDAWNLSGTWTHLTQEPKEKVLATPGKALNPVIDLLGEKIRADYVNARWEFDYNLADLLLSREFYSGSSLFFKPYVGFRAAFINQKSKATFFAQNQGQGIWKVTNKQEFSGYGCNAGVRGFFECTDHFGLYADLNSSLLCGIYHLNQKALQNGVFVDGITPSSLKKTQGGASYAFGIEWDNQFSASSYSVSISAGWEQTIWFNFNQMVQQGVIVPQGDLSLWGYSLKLKLGF